MHTVNLISFQTLPISSDIYQSMKSSAACTCLVLLAWALGTGLLGRPVMAQCPNSIFSALVQLMPCRAAVVLFSPEMPNETCCNAVRAVGRACFCIIVNGPPLAGMDRSLALQLPAKCSVNFEPCDNV